MLDVGGVQVLFAFHRRYNERAIAAGVRSTHFLPYGASVAALPGARRPRWRLRRSRCRPKP